VVKFIKSPFFWFFLTIITYWFVFELPNKKTQPESEPLTMLLVDTLQPIKKPDIYFYLKKLKHAMPDKLGYVTLWVNDAKPTRVHVDSVYCLSVFQDWDDKRFPSEVFKFKNLRYLWVGMRGFTSVPKEIMTLSKLEEIDFQHGFIRTLPPEIGNLSNLKEICLLFCSDFRKLPEEICNLEKLSFMNINFTSIDTSNMPSCIYQRKNFQYIYKNELDGEKYIK
jgi:hypothetical protein